MKVTSGCGPYASIASRWAADIDPDACNTYKINNERSHVSVAEAGLPPAAYCPRGCNA